MAYSQGPSINNISHLSQVKTPVIYKACIILELSLMSASKLCLYRIASQRAEINFDCEDRKKTFVEEFAEFLPGKEAEWQGVEH